MVSVGWAPSETSVNCHADFAWATSLVENTASKIDSSARGLKSLDMVAD